MIWDKTGPLSRVDHERVRLHPYLTERMLAEIPGLAQARQIAVRSALTTEDRLLTAADMYHALIEPRPHRPAQPARGGCQPVRE